MSDKHREIVVHVFETIDEAVRAIQGLKLAGFAEEAIRVSARDEGVEREVVRLTGAHRNHEMTEGEIDRMGSRAVRIVVLAGAHAHLAERVIMDGVVDATGLDPTPDVVDHIPGDESGETISQGPLGTYSPDTPNTYPSRRRRDEQSG